MAELYEDAVLACADLVGRAGASEFEMGWDCPHVPDESDDHNCDHLRQPFWEMAIDRYFRRELGDDYEEVVRRG